jgi:hypothetical protein
MTYIHHFKCIKCHLEFALYSYYEDRHNSRNVYCPERGNMGGSKMHQREQTDRFIFEYM